MRASNIFIGLFTAVLIAIAVIGFSNQRKNSAHLTDGLENYTILKTWELPKKLDEVSGIVWVDKQTLACVQDEDGVIFVYDLKTKSIIEEIPFAGSGDYEGIALHEHDIYVMQSDGLLYKVKDWRKSNREVSSHHTGFKASNNMESLTYSKKDGSLLTVPKDTDADETIKGIYKISFASTSAEKNKPAYQIDLNAELLKPYRQKKTHKTFSPSAIAVHPISNDIYVVEGKHPKLLILDAKGQMKHIYKLDEVNFPQPEGITFSAIGDLYISNEASGGSASIHLVELNKHP